MKDKPGLYKNRFELCVIMLCFWLLYCILGLIAWSIVQVCRW